MFWKAIVVLVAFLAQVCSKYWPFRESLPLTYPYPKIDPFFDQSKGGWKQRF
ncbi:unnamed protein product [Cylicocyclus nassatus]|uniref:Uncharacterized protein n=1 Tax=Cylicocyclus nassatus TaxID=53992 RepID=A0AA36H289_CYLNA|nr:unnamed protein product [Cylicocyclus nassatus]